MVKEIVTSQDGSHSIRIRDTDLWYHSRFGAITESMHVYIVAGLLPLLKRKEPIRIFELGFGTGLNALLSLCQVIGDGPAILYQAVENDPLTEEYSLHLNFCAQMGRRDLQPFYIAMHRAPWDCKTEIHSRFVLQKTLADVEETVLPKNAFELVYFDAFAPEAQPAIWSEAVLAKMRNALKPSGVLVTYCSKGIVRRTLEKLGFSIERLPGPPGKREIIRATKTDG
jgi:tRNA U34 5-methylaminomethyl-2-thiouridine-forming methyltransferase MnmC